MLQFLDEHSRAAFTCTSAKERWVRAVQQNAEDRDQIHSEYFDQTELIEHTFTPFCELLQTITDSSWTEYDAQAALKLWITCLSNAGVELLAYGKQEQMFLQREKQFFGALKERNEIVNFTYGPEAKDWYIRRAHSGDVHAGTFWAMIESGCQSIPGEWIEVDEIVAYDHWRQDRGSRRMGVKRRTLRRFLARARRQDLDSEDVERVKHLQNSVIGNARCRKDGTFYSAQRMFGLAMSLGITAPGLREEY